MKRNRNTSIQNIENNQITNSIIIQSGSENVQANLENILNSFPRPELLNELIKEKLDLCYDYILSDEYMNTDKIIDVFFAHGVNGINASNKLVLYYYKCIIILLKGEEIPAAYKQYLDADKSNYINTISDIVNSPEQLKTKYYLCDIISKYVSIYLLFQNGLYNIIYDFYKSHNLNENFEIYYFSLACFNMKEFDECLNNINKLVSENSPKYEFINILANVAIFVPNIFPQAVNYPYNFDKIRELNNRIIEFKATHKNIIDKNPEIFAQSELSVIAIIEPSNFLSVFQQLPDRIKNTINIKYLIANFFERQCDYSSAVDIYNDLYNITNNSEFLIKLMYFYLCLEKYEKVIEHYHKYKYLEKEQLSPAAAGMYLDALKHTNPDNFYSEFDSIISENKDDVNFVISLSVSSIGCNQTEEMIYPMIVVHKDEIIKMQTLMKSSVATVVIHHGDYELAEEILLSINEFLTPTIVDEICTCVINMPLESRERVLNHLISYGFETENVLGQKINVLLALNKLVAATECLKKLFAISPTAETAGRIVQILNQRQVSAENEYKDYLPYLENQKDPRFCILLSQTYFITGRYELVDDYAFKALLISDDYQTIDSYIRVHLLSLKIHNEVKETDTVIDNTVVTLEDTANSKTYTVCLNSDNYNLTHPFEAIGATHYSKDNTTYYKLIGKKQGDTVNYDNNLCIVTNIINKHTYAIKYAYTKISDGNYESKAILKQITIDSNKDIGEQLMRELPQNNTNLVEKYINRDGNIYWPIESISSGYSMYSELIKTLLFASDGIYYGGLYNQITISQDQKYVISLSSLVVMSHLNMLDLVMLKKDNVIIPRSLLNLITNILQETSDSSILSPGSLIKQDDKIFLVENDKSQADFWANILDVAREFTVVEVNDKTRVEFDNGTISLETVLSKLNVDIYMMDCFILSQHYNAIFLCDDAAFALFNGIINGRIQNFTVLFQLLDNRKKLGEYIKRLSKSNYTYFPFWYANDENHSEIIKDILNTVPKREYYLEITKAINDSFKTLE